MRRAMVILLAVLLIGGCTAAPLSDVVTVRDRVPVCDPGEAPYVIHAEIPETAVATEQTDDLRVFEGPNGDYRICTQILVTDGLDAAVYALCGTARQGIKLEVDGCPECRLAWSADGAVYRARIRKVGDFCYILILRLREGLGGAYNRMINELFSSFVLAPKVRGNEDIRPGHSRAYPGSAQRTIRYRRSAPPPSRRPEWW